MSSSDLSSTRHACGADIHVRKWNVVLSLSKTGGTADCPHNFLSTAPTTLWAGLQGLVPPSPLQDSDKSTSKLSPRLFLYAVELEKELHYVSLKLNQLMRKLH